MRWKGNVLSMAEPDERMGNAGRQAEFGSGSKTRKARGIETGS
jgi:hypothetical protein